ncbi:hypothetical protein O3M35_000891 [Rhynocoris fuscipes]|uniref:SAM domain-containing protein n=1 Tax=Rhynocoris fuscipes TaxID=488301 RepID=A0AAW1DTG8_9HEMI
MKLDCSADSWLKFFTSAGIPIDSARTYAVTFSKNEIQLDMLSEIKKEYLVDMGITLMGHIIAILRHAKTVYEENVTKSTLSSATSSKTQSSPVKAAPKEKPVLKTMPLRIANEKEVTPATSSTKSTVAPAESRLRAVGTSTVQNNATYGPHLKSSNLQVSDKDLPTKKKDSEPVSKTKITSVVSSTTIKKKATEPPHRQHEETNNSKGKVFERLGEEVSSPEGKSSETPSESSSSSNESVFSRLGSKTSPTYSPCSSPVKTGFKTTTVNGEKSFSDFPKIKRVVQNGSKAKMKSIMCTMRADEAEMQAKTTRKRTRSPSPDNFSSGKEFDLLKSNIKSRLGRMSRSTSPSPSRLRSASVDRSIGLRSFGEVNEKRVKLRLGMLNNNRFDERVGANRNTRSAKGSILSKRLSPVKSIALSGLGKTNGGIKSRLGQSVRSFF